MHRIRALVQPLGAVAKTTGASGGDVAIVVAPDGADVNAIHAAIREAGCTVLDLAVDERGVTLA